MRGDSYLPVLVRESLLADGEEPSPWCRPVTVALLFLDVVGFTSRTEEHSRSGLEGVERLSQILNQHFGQQIDVVTNHGGDVVSFAGDALIAIWRAAPGEDLAPACRRACACALELQSGEGGSADGRLPARAVVAAGDAYLSHLGGVAGRWLVSLLGPVLDQVAASMGATSAGKVIVSEPVMRLLGPGLSGEARPGGAFELRSGVGGPAPVPLLPPTLDESLQAQTSRYVPTVVTAWLNTFDERWIGELRQATAVFVALPPWDPREEGWLARVHELIGRLQATVERFEGIVDKLVVDEKGASLLVAFGLPPRAHEDAAARALRCAMELRRIVDGDGGARGIGVATGPVYCGLVGSDVRREYTMIGSAVNTAARLMRKAGQGILCNDTCRAAAPDSIEFASRGSTRVKGIDGDIDIFEPERARIAPRRTAGSEFVGRREELAQLRAALERHEASGGGAVILVEAAAGTGKSRLLAEFGSIGRELGVRTLDGEGSSVERNAPYNAWRLVLGELLGLDLSVELSELTAAASLALEGDAELGRLAPLVNDVLPVALEETEFTRGLSDEARADNLLRLVGDLLSRAAAGGSLALVLDDAHWFDSASWALLRSLVEARPEVVFVVGTRPLDQPAPAEWTELRARPDHLHIDLKPLPPDAVDGLVAGVLGVRAVPAAVRTLIRDKAQGNAFFSEQLALALLDEGHVRVVGGACEIATASGGLEKVTLPATVHGVVHSRLDRLTADEQLLLKVASVLGRTLDLELVGALSGRDDVEALADRLAGRGILESHAGPSGLTYEFGHNTTRDAVYETLLFAQRREMHDAAVTFYEDRRPEAIDAKAPLLVHHATAAENWPKALIYLEKAGFQALERSANAECVDALRRAFELAASQGIEPTATQIASWHWHLSEASFLLGRMDECLEHGYPAMEHLGLPMKSGGGRFGGLMRLIGERNFGWLKPTFGPVPDGEVRESQLRALQLQNRLTDALGFRLDLVGMLYSSSRELALATALDRPGEAARAHMMLYFVMMLMPMKGKARPWVQRALDLLEQEPDPAILAIGLSRVSVAHIQDEVDFAAAEITLERALDNARRVGDLRLLAEVRIGRALYAYATGGWTDTADWFGGAADAARQAGDAQFVAWGSIGEAMARAAIGELDVAERLMTSTQTWVDAATEPGAAVWGTGVHALIAHRLGREEPARIWAERTLERAAAEQILGTWWFLPGLDGMCEVLLDQWEAAVATGAADVAARAKLARLAVKQIARFSVNFAFSVPYARHHQARLHLLSGKAARAESMWREALALAEERRQPQPQLLAHRGLAALAGADSAEGEEHLRSAARLEAASFEAADLAEPAAAG